MGGGREPPPLPPRISVSLSPHYQRNLLRLAQVVQGQELQLSSETAGSEGVRPRWTTRSVMRLGPKPYVFPVTINWQFTRADDFTNRYIQSSITTVILTRGVLGCMCDPNENYTDMPLFSTSFQ